MKVSRTVLPFHALQRRFFFCLPKEPGERAGRRGAFAPRIIHNNLSIFRRGKEGSKNTKFSRFGLIFPTAFGGKALPFFLFHASRSNYFVSLIAYRDVMRYNDTVCNLVSKEFRGINHGRKGGEKKKSYRDSNGTLVRIEQVVSSLRLQWRRSGVHCSSSRHSCERKRNEI